MLPALLIAEDQWVWVSLAHSVLSPGRTQHVGEEVEKGQYLFLASAHTFNGGCRLTARAVPLSLT